MRTKFAMLFFLVLAAPAFAGGLQQIRSPNRSKVLLVDSSGRRDIISIKSGSKIIRLFYGNIGDALDAWKPRLSKLYRIPESQIGKIVLPSFVAAKWISENEVQIDLESSFTETKNFDSFEFTVELWSAATEERSAPRSKQRQITLRQKDLLKRKAQL
jgi:hypothetical protein